MSKTSISKHTLQLILNGTGAGKKHLPKLASGQDTGVDLFLSLPFVKKY